MSAEKEINDAYTRGYERGLRDGAKREPPDQEKMLDTFNSMWKEVIRDHAWRIFSTYCYIIAGEQSAEIPAPVAETGVSVCYLCGKKWHEHTEKTGHVFQRVVSPAPQPTAEQAGEIDPMRNTSDCISVLENLVKTPAGRDQPIDATTMLEILRAIKFDIAALRKETPRS